MKIRLISGALALSAALAVPAAAKDSHDGKWHSNAAKSYWSDNNFPKGFSLTIEMKFEPNKLIYHAVNDTVKDKPPYINDFVSTLDDVTGPLNGNARFNEIRIKRLDDDTFQVLEQKDGDVIVGQYWRFSKDGKSLVRWGVGKSPEGKSKAFLEWFDRVP
jgi:hypothetical protein